MKSLQYKMVMTVSVSQWYWDCILWSFTVSMWIKKNTVHRVIKSWGKQFTSCAHFLIFSSIILWHKNKTRRHERKLTKSCRSWAASRRRWTSGARARRNDASRTSSATSSLRMSGRSQATFNGSILNNLQRFLRSIGFQENISFRQSEHTIF